MNVEEKLEQAIAMVKNIILEARNGQNPVPMSRFLELMNAILPLGSEIAPRLDVFTKKRSDELLSEASRLINVGTANALVQLEKALMLMYDTLLAQKN